jgi:hypothetical protein
LSAQARPRFGLPVALLRHALVLVLAFASTMPQLAVQHLTVSLALAIAVGAVTAVVARGLIGAVFLVAGMLAGFAVVAYQNASTANPGVVLGQDGWLYLALVAVALATYLVVLFLLMRLRRAQR